MSAEQTPDIEALADWLARMRESRNIFDITDEATTVISIDVETLAERFAPVLAAAVCEAEQRAWDEGVRQAETWLRADYEYGTGPDWREQGAEWIADRLADHNRADRVAVDAPEGGEGR